MRAPAPAELHKIFLGPPHRTNPHDRGAVYSVKFGPAGAEFSIDPYFTHEFHAMFAGFGSLGATFYSRKAKNGVLRVNFGAVAAGTPNGSSQLTTLLTHGNYCCRSSDS
jgi:hypothetical protein